MSLTVYEREIAALRLLDPGWDDMSEDERRGRHDTFMWTIDAAVETGVVCWPTQEATP